MITRHDMEYRSPITAWAPWERLRTSFYFVSRCELNAPDVVCGDDCVDDTLIFVPPALFASFRDSVVLSDRCFGFAFHSRVRHRKLYGRWADMVFASGHCC